MFHAENFQIVFFMTGELRVLFPISKSYLRPRKS
jgi:hypothetical protein